MSRAFDIPASTGAVPREERDMLKERYVVFRNSRGQNLSGVVHFPHRGRQGQRQPAVRQVRTLRAGAGIRRAPL